MSVVDRDRFLQCVSRSGLLSKEHLDNWLAEISPDAQSKELALDLIRKKLATKWQGKMLAKGANRLTLGNYLLTDRTSMSEFGDRFAALHRQLSRNVAIQYLPSEVCSGKESKQKIFNIGSKLADLDHPNLLHVYDVDEEKGRIYLVSESNDGKVLADYLADQPRISCESIARIMAGCLEGLIYAHSKDVVHSGISVQTIVVKAGHDVQIGGLTQFAVQNALSDLPVDANADFVALESIGGLLLKRVTAKQRTSKEFDVLSAALTNITQDADSSLVSLREIENREHQATAGDHSPAASSSTSDSASKSTSTVPEEPVSKPSSGESSDRSEPADLSQRPSDSAEGFLTTLARRNPAALICASALSALLLIGGTVLAATKLTTSPVDSAQVSAQVTASQSLQLDRESPREERVSERGKDEKTRRKRDSKKVEPTEFQSRPEALSDSKPASGATDLATDADANRAAIDAIFESQADKKDLGTVEVVTKKIKPVEDSKANFDGVGTGDAQQSTETAAVPIVTPAATMTPKVEISVPDQEFLAAGADPFDKFVKTVDLPETSSTEPTSFGRLILEKRHLLGAEILSTPLVHKSKPIFVMNRSSDDKQAWDIGYKKKKKSDPVLIAKLQKTQNELRFNWLPEAAELDIANYLRNCRIKLSTATHSHWLTLRKPFKIDGFKLGKDRGSVKLDADIPYLPSPIGLAAALKGIKFERLDKKDYREKPYLVPSEITPTVPARMFFHEDADRFLSLDVLADIRKNLILRAALVMQPSPDQPGVVLEDPSKTKQLMQQVRNMAMKAQQASSLAQASSIKKDEKDAYKRVAKKATDQAELTTYYEHVVPQLLEKDIPVTITFSLNEQHRILLAYTVESDETKEK